MLSEHYSLVGNCLLRAIREVLGEAIATDAVIEAWAAVLATLAYICALFAVAHYGDTIGKRFVRGPAHPDSPMAKVYAAACVAVKREFEAQAHKQHRAISQIDLSQERLSALQIDAIRKVAECAVADQILLLETQMSMLGSTYTIAPMLGLFGTVWGISVSFEQMAKQGSANLSEAAPGISSALLTTIVGLIVAIPSAYGCNKLNEKIRFLSIQLENFIEKFATRLQQSFLYE